MHDEVVDRRAWVSNGRFLHALNFCMLLPGPEAQQLAIYLGWLLHRVRGGLRRGRDVRAAERVRDVRAVVALRRTRRGHVGRGRVRGARPGSDRDRGRGHIAHRRQDPGERSHARGSGCVVRRDLRGARAVPVHRARCAGDRGGRGRRAPGPVRRRGRPRARGTGAHRDPRRRAAGSPHRAVAREGGAHPGRRARGLARADRAHRRLARRRRHAHRHGVVLLPRVVDHVRRRLRGARLRERGRGADLRLAVAGPDGRRPRPRREHARAR